MMTLHFPASTWREIKKKKKAVSYTQLDPMHQALTKILDQDTKVSDCGTSILSTHTQNDQHVCEIRLK